MRHISALINGDRTVAAFCHEGVGLIILFGDEADIFAARMGTVTLIAEMKGQHVRFSDAAGKAPVLTLESSAIADLRSAETVHIVRANGEGADAVARNVMIRWPIF